MDFRDIVAETPADPNKTGSCGPQLQQAIVSSKLPPTDAKRSARTFQQIVRSGRRYTNPLISVGHWRRRALLVGAALLAGLIAILFAIGAEHAIEFHTRIVSTSPWLSLLVAPAGFAAMAWVAGRFFPATQGSGIPQTIAASLSPDAEVRGRLLSLKIAAAKVILTLGGLLSGASIGREGPSVQIGASVMHALAGRRFGRIASSRNLIVAGSGAGIAAAFNTPLGGIMFAIEEMCRHHAFRANSATLTAVIFAGLMSLGILGNYTYFGRTPAALGWPGGIWPVLMCGAAGGILGGMFSRLLVASARGLPGRVGDFAAERPIAFAAGCGLATAIVGLVTGGATYATGYAESKAALEGSAPLPFYFFAAKMLVLWLAFVSRIPGGIFAPALAVGAGLGSALAGLSPGDAAPALVILGMVAFLAGMTLAPITSFVIVMEMTANHEMLIPLMAASVIAYGFSRSVSPRALYDTLAIPALERAQAQVVHGSAGGEKRSEP
ncbi:chloride channel protein [Aromatoleum toluclasticum]|uniref:chloride channel protein n=1 Tax=Aromatoleum toluclasticum TaxID=92003 RepID=UPI001D19185E|nr:chloride channel protein [Aromatoleum toluclasticum]MCC4116187.1 chloride channel protein [Aromatoleum toluclasticum]